MKKRRKAEVMSLTGWFGELPEDAELVFASHKSLLAFIKKRLPVLYDKEPDGFRQYSINGRYLTWYPGGFREAARKADEYGRMLSMVAKWYTEKAANP